MAKICMFLLACFPPSSQYGYVVIGKGRLKPVAIHPPSDADAHVFISPQPCMFLATSIGLYPSEGRELDTASYRRD